MAEDKKKELTPEEQIAELKAQLAEKDAENEKLTAELSKKNEDSGKPAKRLKFKATVDGKKREFEVVSPTVEVPGKGKFKTVDLVKDKENAEVLATLLARGSGVFKEV